MLKRYVNIMVVFWSLFLIIGNIFPVKSAHRPDHRQASGVSPTPSVHATPSPQPSVTPTASAQPSQAPTPTGVPSLTPSPTPTETQAVTPTIAVSITPTPLITAVPTEEPEKDDNQDITVLMNGETDDFGRGGLVETFLDMFAIGENTNTDEGNPTLDEDNNIPDDGVLPVIKPFLTLSDKNFYLSNKIDPHEKISMLRFAFLLVLFGIVLLVPDAIRLVEKSNFRFFLRRPARSYTPDINFIKELG